MTRTWSLQDDRQSLVLAAMQDRLPEVIYWGPRLPASEKPENIAAANIRDVSGGMLDQNPELSICPQTSRSFPGQPGILVRTSDGKHLLPDFWFEAAEEKPCALFLDECDTIARARGARNDVGEVSRVVNMLLQLLEDYRGDGLVIAATNHYESLDQAIYRRFDEAIEVPMPAIVEIARLLETSLSALNVSRKANLEQFAASLDGYSFSEVERVAQNAAKRSVMSNRKQVSLEDLERAAQDVKRHF